jgi:hypothetical protein
MRTGVESLSTWHVILVLDFAVSVWTAERGRQSIAILGLAAPPGSLDGRFLDLQRLAP